MEISLVSSFLKMIFALAIVMGLLIGVMYVMKNFMQRQSSSPNHQGLINVLSSKYLGPKSSIVLIEIADQIIVVGISGQQMTPLARIDDPLIVEEMKGRQSQSSMSPFAGDKIAKILSWRSLSGNRKTGKPEK